jgi:hypothetical protein
MPKYVRLPTVVEAITLQDAIDLGDVGLGYAGDWLIQDVTGAFTIMDDDNFQVCFVTASQSSEIQGYDIINTFPVPEPEGE